MKIIALMSVLFSFSCSTLTDSKKSILFSVEGIAELTPGAINQNVILKKFGAPISKTEGELSTWEYNDAETSQNLYLTFNGSGLLQTLIWSPSSATVDLELEKVKRNFSSSKFEVSSRTPSSNKNIVNWVDQNSGTTLVELDNSKKVAFVLRTVPKSDEPLIFAGEPDLPSNKIRNNCFSDTDSH